MSRTMLCLVGAVDKPVWTATYRLWVWISWHWSVTSLGNVNFKITSLMFTNVDRLRAPPAQNLRGARGDIDAFLKKIALPPRHSRWPQLPWTFAFIISNRLPFLVPCRDKGRYSAPFGILMPFFLLMPPPLPPIWKAP